jgi:hypothetical protein
MCIVVHGDGDTLLDFWWHLIQQLTEINRAKCSKAHTNLNRHYAAYSTLSGCVTVLLFEA